MSENANETIQTGANAGAGSEEASAEREPVDDRGTEEPSPAASAPRVVPVTEAKKYRKRAQQAEQTLEEMQRELQEKSQRVTELEATVNDLEQRSRIDQLLTEAEAVDLEAARLLTMAAVREMDEPDAAAAVAELRRTKPFLFRSGGTGASRMSARIDPAQRERAADDSLDHAAAEAQATGDRTDLLRYLRLRRKRR